MFDIISIVNIDN